MRGIGILAYGSLINNPGMKIGPLVTTRIPIMTPFPVEFARLSRTRGYAPTVVPHSSGCPVKAEVLVLSDLVSLDEAKTLLWQRETGKEGSGKAYQESSSQNAVVVRDEPGFCYLDHVLYTDFNPRGKLSHPTSKQLAQAAVESVAKAPDGKDGISYLMDIIKAGVETVLLAQYEEEILALTGTSSLVAALESVRVRSHTG